MYKRRVFKSSAIEDSAKVAEAILEVLQSTSEVHKMQELLTARTKQKPGTVCVELSVSEEGEFADDIWFKRVEQVIVSNEELANPDVRESTCWKLIDKWLCNLRKANYVELSVSSYEGA